MTAIVGGALSCTGSIAQGIKQVRTPGFKGRDTSTGVRVSHTCRGLSLTKGWRWRKREEKHRRFFRHAYTHIRECVYTCCWLGRSRTNAQYAAACAHRRIGRPRGDATALRRYNYLRARASLLLTGISLRLYTETKLFELPYGDIRSPFRLIENRGGMFTANLPRSSAAH